jgi:hypothetical protein
VRDSAGDFSRIQGMHGVESVPARPGVNK